jgi:uncharacterized protein YfaS (alpha-2-macroglobulin family)
VVTVTRKDIAGGRLRSHFVESARWEPDLAIAPGATREVKIRLPDNLTTWRAIVWAADEGDGFARNQAKIEVGLPVEARVSAPAHIYPGDDAFADISARRVDPGTALLHLRGHANGAGASATVDKQASLGRGALLQAPLPLRPTTTGRIDVVGEANAPGGRDGMQQQVTVDDPTAPEHVAQAGWLTEVPLSMPLPTLDPAAIDAKLTMKLGRTDVLLARSWTADLRDYPHRCWEQTLSRAIGAALSLQHAGSRSDWPAAGDEVKQALEKATGFIDRNGLFAYFRPADPGKLEGDTLLTAYTLDALDEMKTLGFAAPDALVQRAQQGLQGRAAALAQLAAKQRSPNTDEVEAIANGALAGRGELEPERLRALWSAWDRLSWFARSQLVRALASRPDLAAIATQGIARLRDAGTLQGVRRVLVDDASQPWEMGSLRRDQCAIIRTLVRVDRSEQGRQAIAQWQRGLFDLYAGGNLHSDTQTSAQCLLALHAVQALAPPGGDIVDAEFAAGSQHQRLHLGADDTEAAWAVPTLAQVDRLHVARADHGTASAAFVASLDDRLDQRRSKPVATGLHLDRSYEVLRNGAWKALDADAVHEGDWVRVRLRLDVPAFRHFVAISDPAPGGWVPEDIDLSGVASAEVHRNAGWSSWGWFGSRQLGATVSRFYAQYLPPGPHEIVYYAQVLHRGRYFAPPATAELMYGASSYARTAPANVTILP